jgi:hypothetical protein
LSCWSTHRLPALLLPLHAVAQAWPVRPVRIMVPYPAGGTSAILARTLALAAGVAPGVLAPSVADFHRLRKMGVRYLPMVISGLIGTASRSAVAGAREPA